MNGPSKLSTKLPPDQEAIKAKCFHPTGTFVEFPIEAIEQSIPGRFEKIVRQHPNRLAVKTKEHALTYKQLNEAANRIAQAILVKRGPGSEPIALLLEHGLAAIIGCLGSLKAGKILVAVDPSFPVKRIAYILDDSQAGAIVTDNQNLSLATALTKTRNQVINIDTLDSNPSAENIGLQLSPDATAQIRYTSGSTGQPKGIVRTHRRNLHGIMLTINAAHICPDDRLLILRHLSFAAKDIFNGLLTGAAIVPFDIKKDGLARLADLLIQERITYYTSTPSTFRYFINELSGKEQFPSVRMIQLGGEPLSSREVESYKKHFFQNCILMNQLSSNETGTLCQYYLDKETEVTPVVPVGYPVEAKEILLLDENGKEVAPNQIGEIAVRSRYLSSEYWRNSQLTNAKYSPDPTGGDKRIYLTGDLGRMLHGGRLVYLGRKDLEVKIRGYKTAIPEIEMALCECAHVKDAAVMAWDNQAGEKYLAAYVVPREESGPKINELREFLRGKLPDYMIPAEFVYLKSLPSINGKLDRKALPRPDHKRPDLSYPYVPQRNEVEQKLILIWEEVLGVSPIGVHDHFLDLGGHSLSASRTISRVLDAFRVEISLTSLFESATVADMAAIITQSHARKIAHEHDLAHTLAEVEELSDEETERLLAEERDGD